MARSQLGPRNRSKARGRNEDRPARNEAKTSAAAGKGRGTSGPTRVQSVDRAARLLHLIASTPERERTVKHLAAKMGTSIPTMYHLVNTLVDARLLTRDSGRQYHLGIGVAALANAYFQQTQPPPELLDPLRRVIQATGETAYLSGLVRGELELLAELAGTRSVRVMDLKPGFRGAAHARASGKVLLAFSDVAERNRYLSTHPLDALTPNTITDAATFLAELEEVRRRGYATEFEEFTEAVACCAVPIVIDGLLVGAYTIAAPLERLRMSMDEYLAVLRAAAESVASTRSNWPDEELREDVGGET